MHNFGNKEYDEGYMAAKNGHRLNANPYCEPYGDRDKFFSWFAGWCYATQCMASIIYD